tara:strand:+ start:529 stop:1203 length:675 start_codon:yes stop_codon:yes gene_type:complete
MSLLIYALDVLYNVIFSVDFEVKAVEDVGHIVVDDHHDLVSDDDLVDDGLVEDVVDDGLHGKLNIEQIQQKDLSCWTTGVAGRIMSVSIYEYLGVLYGKDVLRQVSKDLPRCQCFVNGKRVRSVIEMQEMVESINESYMVSMMPFAAQTVMALPLQLLYEAYDNQMVIVDGKQALHVEFVVQRDSWSVQVTKKMYIVDINVSMEISVFYESTNTAVLVYWDLCH